MGVFNKDKEATQPLEETQQEEVVTPEPVATEVEDRRHYNCDECKGEGLVFENQKWVLCSKCSGTGKLI
jgi:DnaJ-class molecular chaperone